MTIQLGNGDYSWHSCGTFLNASCALVTLDSKRDAMELLGYHEPRSTPWGDTCLTYGMHTFTAMVKD